MTAVEGLDFRGTMARVHVALDGLPEFVAGGAAPGPYHGGVTVAHASVDRLEAAWEAQRVGRIAEDPVVEFTVPTAHDPSLAPPGKHLLITGVQQVPFDLAEGTWDDERAQFDVPRRRTARAGLARNRGPHPCNGHGHPARSTTHVRPDRGQYLSRGAHPRSALRRAPAAVVRGLPHAPRGPLSVRIRDTSWRRRVGCSRTQRGLRPCSRICAACVRAPRAPWAPRRGPNLPERLVRRPRARRAGVFLAKQPWLRPAVARMTERDDGA